MCAGVESIDLDMDLKKQNLAPRSPFKQTTLSLSSPITEPETNIQEWEEVYLESHATAAHSAEGVYLRRHPVKH